MLDPVGAAAPLISEPARDPRTVASSVDGLVQSINPAEVFASLASLSVPAFSDRCIVDLHEFGKPALRITRPDSGPPLDTGVAELRTTFDAPAPQSETGYTGVVVHGWSAGEPAATDTALAAMMVRCAVTAVAQARSEHAAAAAAVTAENLGIALRTSRRIGIAIGILIAARGIDDQAAFELLRAASQRTSRKLRDIAQDVIDTGSQVIG